MIAPGRHPLRIRGIAGDADLVLDVQPGSYGILGPTNPGIHFDEIEIERVPDHLVWGTFRYATHDLDPEIDSILAGLTKLGASPVHLGAGTYQADLVQGYRDRFHILPSGAMVRDDGLGYRFSLPFAVAFSGDRNELRDLVARAATGHGTDLLMTVLDSDGDVFLSWYRPPD